MRQCPFNDCGQVVESDRFCCRTHWFMLSKEKRQRIWSAWHRYQAGDLGLDGLKETQQAVIDEVQPRSLF